MSEDRYPILVEQFDAKHPSDIVACTGCDREQRWNPENGDPDDLCINCVCGAALTYKFAEADKCPGCGTLWFAPPRSPLGLACSRRCLLQAEYAEALKARAA